MNNFKFIEKSYNNKNLEGIWQTEIKVMIKCWLRNSKKENMLRGILINILNKEKLSVEEALRETIKAIGIKSFADKSNLSIQVVSDFSSQRQKWSTDKLARHIKDVFKCDISRHLRQYLFVNFCNVWIFLFIFFPF